MPNLLQFDPGQFVGFFIIFTRLGGLMLIAPTLGDNNIPPQIKIVFTFLLSLVFFPVVAVLYFNLPLRPRRVFLLAASFYFYCVFSVPLSLLLVWSIVLDYSAARVIHASRRSGVRKAALVVSLVGNLGILATFKYLDFFSYSLASVLGFSPWPELNLVLPMGISFYTFQTMAYTIDVYRG